VLNRLNLVITADDSYKSKIETIEIGTSADVITTIILEPVNH
jgi:hypothetical protein